MKTFKFIIYVFIVFTKTMSYAETNSSSNIKLQIQMSCSLKPLSIVVNATLAEKNLSIQLPINTISNFKSGKLKGCDAILKHSKLAQLSLSQKTLKNFLTGYKVTAILPANENGMQFDLSYDLLIFKKTDGQLLSGPVILAGGLENSVENEVISASAAEIIINQSSSAEGETSVEKITFIFQSDKWVQATASR